MKKLIFTALVVLAIVKIASADLLVLHPYENISILTPVDFLNQYIIS